MTTVELGNIGSKEQAEKIADKLNGKTFYNFRVDYSPMAGNYPVSVSTDTEADVNETKDMILFILATEL